jgi:hypothetical protein
MAFVLHGYPNSSSVASTLPFIPLLKGNQELVYRVPSGLSDGPEFQSVTLKSEKSG